MGSIPKEDVDVAFSVINLAVMFVLSSYAYSVLVVCNSGSLT